MPDPKEVPAPTVQWAASSKLGNLAGHFRPITLRRQLKLFGKALGLEPDVTGVPDSDFLVHIFEGRGHQEQLRKAAPTQYRNLEHFLRGAHRPTPTTWALMLRELRTDDATLRSLAHGKSTGPLLPIYLEIFLALEGFFTGTYRFVTFDVIKCECCGGDVLNDSTQWWDEQTIRLQEDAYEFVDRLLGALVGAASLMDALTVFTSAPNFDKALLQRLAAPEQHPIGNWLDEVKRVRKLRHDWQLTVGIATDTDMCGPVPDGRLRKWRSGQDLLPLEKALRIISATENERILKHALYAARVLSLAIDVVQATALTLARPPRGVAQRIVSARLLKLETHLGMGLVAFRKLKSDIRS